MGETIEGEGEREDDDDDDGDDDGGEEVNERGKKEVT